MVQLFFFFQSTWAMWITALAPELGTIANLLPFFLVSAEVFNGALMFVYCPFFVLDFQLT
jgi:ATP-binding cassette subfamily G (WHITE) protein 2 (SNQ2)